MTLDENLFAVASPSERTVKISLAWLGTERLDQLRNQDRNMLKHGSVTGAVTLPVVIEALDCIFERRIVFEEAIHADYFEDIT
jgi:hypothetical protein